MLNRAISARMEFPPGSQPFWRPGFVVGIEMLDRAGIVHDDIVDTENIVAGIIRTGTHPKQGQVIPNTATAADHHQLFAEILVE